MSIEAIASPVILDIQGDSDGDVRKVETMKPTGLHSPPDSNNAIVDGSDSELSDLDDAEADKIGRILLPHLGPKSEAPSEEDIGEVLPDHYSGTVPVFKPTMKQFKDFKVFMSKIDSFGMKSGIVKIIPPQEWKDAQPNLDNLIKQIRVRDPIKQEIMGSNGTYRQVNILHQRSYNLPQWRQLCDQSEHQPPARRGERRANADKPRAKPTTRSRASVAPTSKKMHSKSRRGRVSRKPIHGKEENVESDDRPMTPVSPKPENEEVIQSVELDPVVKEEVLEDDTPVIRRMGGAAKPKTQSTSARRKYIRREGSAMVDEAAFKDFDYHMDVSEYTPERCEELERTYWRTLTYAPPLYGADLPGTLFDNSAEIWNLNKLPNLLDVLGTKVPGVNTAYLYLGMWKATFAWHLEDVDLYSINYLHFGAPKQWYSISQGDARRFEAAMKNLWPTEAKACDQFLRHKGFLISPAHLKQHYNITVNKCVSYPGEFVVTYPYGYHSGYNLGYNCAEAVNFALDSWLPMGKIAKRCQCAQAQDSVWVDVYEIERKLRGESTEYEDTEDEDDEDDEEDTGLATPPSSHTVKLKAPSRKRKRSSSDKENKKIKKIRLRHKVRAEPPCCLCPNDMPFSEILPTDDGRKAHRLCALYVPETYIETAGGEEVVVNVTGINKARLELKCLYCRSKKGACFQCSQKKCARAYHATCAAAAGAFVEEADVPVFGEDGTEYKEQAFEFSCRFHRTKRDKKHDGDVLENDARVRSAAAVLKNGDICQMQFHRGDIFAGVVVENRHDEQTLLLDIIPAGDRVEVDWKWLLLPDASDFRLPKASANAIPMPTTRKAKDRINARRPVDELPRKDDTFVEGFTWAEFHASHICQDSLQARVDLHKENQMWYYLGKASTESKARYTEDLAMLQHNPKSSFLDTIPKPAGTPMTMAPPPQPRRPHTTASRSLPPTKSHFAMKTEKPYEYKPRKPIETGYGRAQFVTPKFIPQAPTPSLLQNSRGDQQVSLQQPCEMKELYPDPQVQDPPPSTSFTRDRFAPVGGSNGFPQLPGLTRPPAHMKSGHFSQPPSRAWSSSASVAHLTPMTSSALKSPGPSRPVNTYQNYSFFQVHHNRDLTRYRSPYATWGFANGFEGNFRAFMAKAQRSLSGGPKIVSQAAQPPGPPFCTTEDYKFLSSSRSSQPQVVSSTNPHPPVPETLHATSRLMPVTRHMLVTGKNLFSSPSSIPTSLVSEAGQPNLGPLHPAIRPQWQQSCLSVQNTPNSHHVNRISPQATRPVRGDKTQSFPRRSHTPTPLPSYTQESVQGPITTSAILFPAVGSLQATTNAISHTAMEQTCPSSSALVSASNRWWPQPALGFDNLTSEYPSHRKMRHCPPSVTSDAVSDDINQQVVGPAGSPRVSQGGGASSKQAHHTSVSSGNLPDIPADSTALVEQMMENLRRASERDSTCS